MEKTFMRTLIACVVIALSTAACRAAEELDLSTPTSAMRSFAKAIDAGDVEQARKCVEAKDPADQAQFAAGVKYTIAMQKLKKAINQKFGENADKAFAELFTEAPADFFDQVIGYPDTISETITGDKADVKVGSMEMAFEKVEGEWKISASGNRAPNEIVKAEATRNFIAPVKAMNALSAEIAAGKFQDVDNAKAAFKQRLAKVNKAATAPAATQP